MNKNESDSDSADCENIKCITSAETCETKYSIDMKKTESVVFGMFLMCALCFFIENSQSVLILGLISGAFILIFLHNRGYISR